MAMSQFDAIRRGKKILNYSRDTNEGVLRSGGRYVAPDLSCEWKGAEEVGQR